MSRPILLVGKVGLQRTTEMSAELLASITKWRRQTRNSELLAILDAAEASLRPKVQARSGPKRDRAAYMRDYRRGVRRRSERAKQ